MTKLLTWKTVEEDGVSPDGAVWYPVHWGKQYLDENFRNWNEEDLKIGMNILCETDITL